VRQLAASPPSASESPSIRAHVCTKKPGILIWTAEYRSLEEARASIARWIEEYNHDRPHHGVQNRTPHEAFLAFAAVLNSETLTV
jgi:transposase InsO family protein